MILANPDRRSIDGVPDGGAVLLPVEQFRALVARSEDGLELDLTVFDVAELFGRSPVTVRAWIRSGRLGAYRFRSRAAYSRQGLRPR